MFLTTFFLIAAALPVSASTFIIGGTGGNNAFPWTEYDAGGKFQEFYTGLPNGFTITAIGFKSIPDQFSHTETISATLALSTATTISTNPSANVGADNRIVFNGIQTFTPGVRDANGFDLFFNLTSPFTVTNSAQWVLLDIVINSSITGGVGFSAGTNDSRTLRGYQSFGQGAFLIDGITLETEFVSQTPEPANLVLMAFGLVGLIALRKRG